MAMRVIQGGSPEAKTQTWRRVMLVGETGTGKSSQIPTLSGPKIIYSFDPNSSRNIAPYLTEDDYILEFLPDEADLDVEPRSVQDKVGGGRSGSYDPQLYKEWLADYRERDKSGEFTELGKDGGWVVIDSISFLQEAVHDAVVALQAKAGSKDIRADAQIVGQRVLGLGRLFTALPCHFICTAHYRRWKPEDEPAKTELEAYGKARRLLPGTFNDVFATFADIPVERNRLDPKGSMKYLIQTVPEDDCPAVRSSIQPPLAVLEDVTIDFSKSPVGQGIGKWFNPPQAAKGSKKEKAA